MARRALICSFLILSLTAAACTSASSSAPTASTRSSTAPALNPRVSADEACRLYESAIQASSESHDWNLMETDLTQARRDAASAEASDSRYQSLHTHLTALLQAVMSYDDAAVKAAGLLVKGDCANLPS